METAGDLSWQISFTSDSGWRALACLPLLCASSTGCEGQMFDIILGLAVAAGMFGFLILALARPGRF
ncbi:hypothetical protein [Phaeovulum sp. W22_SRMD_FR3]|uniref:hypothetical protein n=1 Tax=Phaeovulum sp. W22_SRMD_FR3 TaxID=3240274 RepID=UPI003F9B0AFA